MTANIIPYLRTIVRRCRAKGVTPYARYGGHRGVRPCVMENAIDARSLALFLYGQGRTSR